MTTIKLRKTSDFIKLSNAVFMVILNIVYKISMILEKSFRSLYTTGHFLRNFDYSKANLTRHFMEKASSFFGIEWEAGQVEVTRETSKGEQKNRLKKWLISPFIFLPRIKNEIKIVQELKKNNQNFLRAPE